jgi:hypothetical protein
MKQRPKTALGMNHTDDPEDGRIWEVLTEPMFPEMPVRPLADFKGCRFRRSKTRERIAKAQEQARILRQWPKCRGGQGKWQSKGTA